MNLFVFRLAFLFLHPALAAWAGDPIFLFPAHSTAPSAELLPVENYDEIVARLVSGDLLAFEDGARFEFLGQIGQGQTTKVLRVRAHSGAYDGQIMALRIPIMRQTLEVAQKWDTSYLISERGSGFDSKIFRLTFSVYIDETILHASQFEKGGFGPRFYGGLAGQYAALEFVDRKFSLDEFLKGTVALTPERQIAVEAALAKFTRQTAGIVCIKDIQQPGQVLFDGQKFVLVDWFRVNFVEKDTHPAFFYKWEGLVESMIQPLLNDLHYSPKTPEGLRHQEFLKRLRARIRREWSEARLDLLVAGVNPLTQRPVPGPHSWIERNNGSWKEVYTALSQLKRERDCQRLFSKP